MSPTHPTVVSCPVCASYGSALSHDVRASLVYYCHDCRHEWQIAPADELPEDEPAVSTHAARTPPQSTVAVVPRSPIADSPAGKPAAVTVNDGPVTAR